jgi:glycosyltransferase involved in cell wall biosynthesis
MALGRPVIAGSVGGVSEIVVDGETGLLVRPLDSASFAFAFHEIAAEPSRARALGDAGKARYERLFTVEKMLDDYVELLHLAMSSEGTG